MEGENILISKYPEIIEDSFLFNKLDNVSLKNILSLFHEEHLPNTTCLIPCDSNYDQFYLIISGRIRMYQIEPVSKKEVTLFILAKNDVFDLFCLMDGNENDVFYECLDNVVVLAAPMADIRKWYINNPEAYKELLPYAGKQLRMLENFVSDITFTDISTRILKLLIKNVHKNSQNLELIEGLSNKEVAYLMGSTRTVVNRHLQRLKRNGSIRIARNRLEISDLSVLLRLLELQQQKLKKDI